MHLNDPQRATVEHDGHLVIVAIPGSGKTRCLVERTARLRSEDPTAPIIVVTFTREAAKEVRERLNQRLPSLARTQVATFHALALQQLLSGKSARVCSPGDQRALLRRAWLETGDDSAFPAFVSAVDGFTCGNASALGSLDFAAGYDRYLELLLQLSAIDFSQAILQAVDGMEGGQLRPLPCQHLLVDEVQDIDATQLRWVAAHVQAGAVLTVVGDDDQAIYGFRNSAGIEGMREIVRAYSSRVITLATNYRSHSEILSWASRLIGHNTNRIPKSLLSHKGPGGNVYLHDQCLTDLDEAEVLASYAKASDERFAVIARTNAKLDLVAGVLDDHGIPFSRPGRAKFWESEEPALFLGLLGPMGLHDPLTYSAACTRAGVCPEAKEPAPISELRSILAEYRHLPDPSQAIHAVTEWLHNNMRGVGADRREGVHRVIDACRSAFLKMRGSLSDRIALALRPGPTKTERVSLLTMHGAKGLEFDTAWIVGCQADTIPSKKADSIEEERRLLYVAMTRAERTLHLSFAWNQVYTRRSGEREGHTYLRPRGPSSFLTIDLGLQVCPPANVSTGST